MFNVQNDVASSFVVKMSGDVMGSSCSVESGCSRMSLGFSKLILNHT